MRASGDRQRSRPTRNVADYPFDETENQALLKLWRDNGDRVAYSKLFGNCEKIIDGVIGYFVNRGILWEGSHDDYKQEALCRLIQILPSYEIAKGKLYSFVYGSSSTHIRMTHWNEMRKTSRLEYEPEERTLEMLLGGKIFVPHIGLDLQRFVRCAFDHIRCQRFTFTPKINRLMKTHMFRMLSNREHLDVDLPLLQKQIAQVRYRMIICDLLDDFYPDETDSSYSLFRQFFR